MPYLFAFKSVDTVEDIEQAINNDGWQLEGNLVYNGESFYQLMKKEISQNEWEEIQEQRKERKIEKRIKYK